MSALIAAALQTQLGVTLQMQAGLLHQSGIQTVL